MRKVLILCFTLLFLATVMGIPQNSLPVQANTIDYSQYINSNQKTINSTVNLRRGATVNYAVVTKIPASSTVTIVNVFENASKEVWLSIKFGSSSGWVRSDMLVLSQLLDSKRAEASGNVHSGATTNYSVVGTIQSGKSYTIHSTFINSSNETWFRVEYSTGKFGWVENKVFEKPSLLKKAEQTGTIHSGATSSYRVVGNVSVGTTYSIVQTFTNAASQVWHRIEYSPGKFGWVENKVFEKPSLLKKAEQTGTIHSGATSSYRVVGNVSVGTTYSIVQTFTNAASQVWHRIEYSPGKFGWVENKVFEKPSLLKKAEQTGTIHSGATSSYRVVGNVSVGTTYSIVQTFTNAASQIWHRIEYAPGQFGWVEDKVFDPLNRKTLISSATVHSGAQQNYRVVGTATKGTSYTVLATFTNAFGEKWYRIQFTTTVAGWIRANAIDPIYVSQPIVVPQETIIRVNVAVANVRSMPSTTASISTKWSQGALKTAQGLVNAQDGKWYQIRDAEHGLVYLHESVISSVEMHPDLKIGSTVYLNRSKPLLYSNPSYSGGVVGAGIQGANYTIVDFAVSTDTTRWYKVQNPSIVAWVPEFELVAQVETRYTAKPTFLYRSATVTGGTSESLTLSQPVQLLRQLGTWWNVETSRGNRGWMLASDITNFPVSGVFDGKYEVRNGQTYLTWKTSTDVSVRYSILSSSTFRIHGNMTTLAPVNGANPAVRTITYGTSGNGTRYADITLSPGYTYTFRKTATEVFIKLHTKGLAGKKIIIDAGHGGKDSGAVGVTGLVEKEVNLSTATYLKQELEARGATVLMIRSNDTFYELVERTTLSNTTDFDAFVSIHADSYSRDSRGSTTFYNSTTSYNGPKSAQLAQSIQTNLIANIGTYNRGFRDATYFVIRNNELPAVLVELAFLSNPTEEAMLKTTDFRKRAAVGITKGLEEFFQK